MPVTADRRSLSSLLFLLGICCLVASLPLSNAGMSIAQGAIAVAWALEGKYKEKLNRLWKSNVALILLSLYLLHVIGLFYTSDVHLGIKDLRIKLPLFLLPLFFFSMDFYPSPKQFRIIIYVFVAAVFAGTLSSMAAFSGIIEKRIDDIRDISLFISYIRFSLLICIAILLCGWLAFEKGKINATAASVLFTLLAVWLTIFLFILESITGIVALMTVTFILTFLFAIRQKVMVRIFLFTLLFSAPVFLFFYLQKTAATISRKPDTDFAALEEKTKAGNLYYHDTISKSTENGNLVWIYICEKELEQSWNLLSEFDYNGKDLKEQQLKMTLLRYMTSKGLRKDAEGVKQLSREDIQCVEAGIANVNYRKMGNISSRIYQVIWEYYNYKDNGNPSGHSVMQRIEFWKAAAGVVLRFPLTGVGTGDIVAAYKEQYEHMGSPLSQRYRLRAHNQYLSIGAAFGIPGMIVFLITLFAPYFILRKGNDYFCMTFLLIALISFITEDTLETQAGATFFAFFNAFFLRFRLKDELSNP